VVSVSVVIFCCSDALLIAIALLVFQSGGFYNVSHF